MVQGKSVKNEEGSLMNQNGSVSYFWKHFLFFFLILELFGSLGEPLRVGSPERTLRTIFF